MLIKISDLEFYEKNAKAHPSEQIEKIKKSILKFGFRGGVKVTRELMIIAGHGRVKRWENFTGKKAIKLK